jgi:hypothetical protein
LGGENGKLAAQSAFLLEENGVGRDGRCKACAAICRAAVPGEGCVGHNGRAARVPDRASRAANLHNQDLYFTDTKETHPNEKVGTGHSKLGE